MNAAIIFALLFGLMLTGMPVSISLGLTVLTFLFAPEIAALYTVSSTVARTAMNYGFNAYAFWPVFPFKERTRDFFRQTMGTVPDEFHIQSLDRAPVSYASPQQVHESFVRFQAALNAAIEQYWDGFKPPSG